MKGPVKHTQLPSKDKTNNTVHGFFAICSGSAGGSIFHDPFVDNKNAGMVEL